MHGTHARPDAAPCPHAASKLPRRPASNTQQRAQRAPPLQRGSPGMRINNPSFHSASADGRQQALGRSYNHIYAVYDNAQCYPAYIIHYDVE